MKVLTLSCLALMLAGCATCPPAQRAQCAAAVQAALQSISQSANEIAAQDRATAAQEEQAARDIACQTQGACEPLQ